MLKNQFPPNIVPVKYNMSTVHVLKSGMYHIIFKFEGPEKNIEGFNIVLYVDFL